MQFDAGRWQILGNAEQIQKSNERRKIIECERQATKLGRSISQSKPGDEDRQRQEPSYKDDEGRRDS